MQTMKQLNDHKETAKEYLSFWNDNVKEKYKKEHTDIILFEDDVRQALDNFRDGDDYASIEIKSHYSQTGMPVTFNF